jgi:hypothetical protein
MSFPHYLIFGAIAMFMLARESFSQAVNSSSHATSGMEMLRDLVKSPKHIVFAF